MAANVGISDRDTEIRLPRATAVKNKSAATKQVQLLNPTSRVSVKLHPSHACSMTRASCHGPVCHPIC